MERILIGSHVVASGQNGRYEILDTDGYVARLKLLGNDKWTGEPIDLKFVLERIPVSTLSLLYPLQPLCDVHARPTTPVVLEGHVSPGDKMTVRGYGCNVQGCTRGYDEQIGYLDFVVGRPLLGKEAKTACAEDEAARYLAEAHGEPPRRSGVWACPRCRKEVQMID